MDGRKIRKFLLYAYTGCLIVTVLMTYALYLVLTTVHHHLPPELICIPQPQQPAVCPARFTGFLERKCLRSPNPLLRDYKPYGHENRMKTLWEFAEVLLCGPADKLDPVGLASVLTFAILLTVFVKKVWDKSREQQALHQGYYGRQRIVGLPRSPRALQRAMG